MKSDKLKAIKSANRKFFRGAKHGSIAMGDRRLKRQKTRGDRDRKALGE